MISSRLGISSPLFCAFQIQAELQNEFNSYPADVQQKIQPQASEMNCGELA
jgi:hypothetical protein